MTLHDPEVTARLEDVTADGILASLLALADLAADGDLAAASEARTRLRALHAYLSEGGNPLPRAWAGSLPWADIIVEGTATHLPPSPDGTVVIEADLAAATQPAPYEPPMLAVGDQFGFDFDEPAAHVSPVGEPLDRQAPAPLPVVPPVTPPSPIPAAPLYSTTLIGPGSPLADVKNWVRAHLDTGSRCPACDQMAKIYKRRLNSTMARALITLYRHAGRGFAHAPSLPGDTHEMSQLSWWGFVEDEKTRRPDGGRKGYWRLTQAGEEFVLGRAAASKYALTYDGECLGLDGPSLMIADALGKKFDYAELMAA